MSSKAVRREGRAKSESTRCRGLSLLGSRFDVLVVTLIADQRVQVVGGVVTARLSWSEHVRRKARVGLDAGRHVERAVPARSVRGQTQQDAPPRDPLEDACLAPARRPRARRHGRCAASYSPAGRTRAPSSSPRRRANSSRTTTSATASSARRPPQPHRPSALPRPAPYLRRPHGHRRRAPKYLQAQMGHSSIRVTLDLYGHLFPDANRGVKESRKQATQSETAESRRSRKQPFAGVARGCNRRVGRKPSQSVGHSEQVARYGVPGGR
jgi:hypothetical protein